MREKLGIVLASFCLIALAGILFAATDAQFIVKDSASITPYSTTTKSYASPVRKIEIYNPNALNIRVIVNTGSGDKTMADTTMVVVIKSTDAGAVFSDINLQSASVLLKGNTATDTGTVVLWLYK